MLRCNPYSRAGLTYLVFLVFCCASCSKPAPPTTVGDAPAAGERTGLQAGDGLPGHAAPGEPDSAAASDQTNPLETDAAPQAVRAPDIHFVPTPQEVVARMLELAQVTKGDVVYDLGCGDGRIVVTAAKQYGCQATGFDIDPQRVRESLANVQENDVEALVAIRNADIFELDLTPASVVSLYLLPRLNVKLIPQLKQLKPGSRIVSHDFDMRGVEPDKVETMEDGNGVSHTIYLWTTPLKIDESVEHESNPSGVD